MPLLPAAVKYVSTLRYTLIRVSRLGSHVCPVSIGKILISSQIIILKIDWHKVKVNSPASLDLDFLGFNLLLSVLGDLLFLFFLVWGWSSFSQCFPVWSTAMECAEIQAARCSSQWLGYICPSVPHTCQGKWIKPVIWLCHRSWPLELLISPNFFSDE